MDILRTPEERFDALPDCPWPPTYRRILDGRGEHLRIASLEAGPEEGPVVLLLHGEPSWSFLYRFMIGPLAAAGCRVLAPDLVGFGRSDKPAAQHDYSYARHIEWLRLWLDAAELADITLFCQDWGGLIGLRLVAEQPERFVRVATANTFLPTGDQAPGPAFEAWKQFAASDRDFAIGRILQKGTLRELSAAEAAAYDAPFPDPTYQAGARRFPQLVPVTPDDVESEPNRQAWQVLRQWRKPWLTFASDQDPITRGAERIFQQHIPGCAGQPHHVVAGGHFLQEDAGAELAAHLLVWMQMH